MSELNRRSQNVAAALLLFLMLVLAGGASLRQSPTVDEFAHIGAGLSYLQKFDLRLNAEHPPLAKMLAAVPLLFNGTRADYTSTFWTESNSLFSAYTAQWMFGDAVLGRWNDWKKTLRWARVPMMILTLILGWMIYDYGSRLGGASGGLLCLTLYVSAPVFLATGPLVVTDIPITLFVLIALWRLGEIWASPSARNSILFALALAAALLSKFTALLLLAVIPVLFLQTRIWPTAAEPTDTPERKAWRRLRWRAALKGVLWAGVIVYAFYLIFSWNQPNDALDRIGTGPWAAPIRRILMPIWLYVRGVGLMFFFSSRPTLLLGHYYSHGVPFYFPVVLVLKSPLGFLALLAMGIGSTILFLRRRSPARGSGAIPSTWNPHWRVLMVGFAVFTMACLASRLNIGVRHFSIPLVLIILMLAPLPYILSQMGKPRVLKSFAFVLAASCLISVVPAYPNFIPFINSLAMGRPAYTLVNASNVDWNQGLPEIEGFLRDHRLTEIGIDWVSLSDPAVIVPQLRPWDCQTPAATDSGKWMIVAATVILEYHNCGWLQEYPRESLAGGSMYAIHLPEHIPEAGEPGGPPRPSERRSMFGTPFDLRAIALDVERHPEKLPDALAEMLRKVGSSSKP